MSRLTEYAAEHRERGEQVAGDIVVILDGYGDGDLLLNITVLVAKLGEGRKHKGGKNA